jgi:hypothetical protein
MTDQSRRSEGALALPERHDLSGHLEPVIGRVVQRDVQGYFGFPLIKAGQTITPTIAERAQNLGRLFELIAATEEH